MSQSGFGAAKLAWTGDVVQETTAEQSNGAVESSVNVFKGHVRSTKLAVESVSSVGVLCQKRGPKTVGVLDLCSGESELAAVVSGATEGLGLQSILVDFGLCEHVAVKSDATTFYCWRSEGAGSRAFVEIGVSNMSGLEILSNAQNTVLWSRIIAAPYESV